MKEVRDRLDDAYVALPRTQLKVYTDSLSQILNCAEDVKKLKKYDQKFAELVEEFESASGHTVANLLRNVGIVEQLSYLDVLKDVADELGYKPLKSSTSRELELEIVRRFLEDLWGKLTASQKDKMKAIILDTLESQKGSVDDDLIKRVAESAAPFAAIFTGNAAGFSLYIAATSGLSAVASALGLSLSFGTYTALTSGLSVLLGPLGLVAAGVFATYKLGQPSYERKLIPSIMLLTALRAEIEMTQKNVKKRSSRGSNDSQRRDF